WGMKGNVTPGARAGSVRAVWAGAVGLGLLIGGMCQRSVAQVSGSIQAGQASGSVTSDGGQAVYGQPSPSLTAAGGRVGGRFGGGIARPGSPYGQLNYGRNGLFGFSIQDNFVGGIPRIPQWSGLIDQNFEIMRQTSPFPNRYAGGIYNPRPSFGHRYG